METGVDRDRLERLQLVTDAALAHIRLEDLLQALLERTREALGTDTAAIFLLDEDRGELVARAAVGLEEEVERGVRIPVGGGFAGRVAADRLPVLLPDVDHAHVLNPLLREKGVKTLLGVPLIVDDELIGVLHVGTLVPRRFDPEDVVFLQLVADRAAIAIEHARLYESERLARQRLENVLAVTDVALAHLELEELLGELLQRIRDTLAVDTSAILLLDEERGELVARAAVGLEEEVERGVRIPLGKGFAGRIAAERRPVILARVEPGSAINPVLFEKGIASLLGVPLVAEGHVLGVLHVGSLTPRAFTDDDVELLQIVGDRAALAIERARVHEEMLRLDQLKLNFVAVASHELRTPATSVYGIIATLRQRGEQLAPELRAELEETLWTQTERLRRVIEQLLDLSRLDAKAIDIHPEPLVLRSLVIELANAIVDPREGQVQVDIDPRLAVLADRLALERILSNLLGNALRYGMAPVVVTAGQRDRHLRITVEDAGPGVAPDVVPRLFERFERGLEGHGSGLGLAIAKAYAQAHGGDLVYEPASVAGGARFELLLPS